MAAVSEQTVLDALRKVIDPARRSDIVSLNMVSGLVVKDGNVGFAIEVDPARGQALEPLRQQAERVVQELPGVTSATVVLTAHKPAPAAPGGQRAPQPGASPIPGVRAILAVASGKGGVGKSTTAANLALGLAAEGARVGLLDADVYGPSMPRMMGLQGRPTTRDGKTLEPMRNYGIAVMSMGFMVDEEAPMIWRGPIVTSAIQQMLREVNWGELDVLVVDMPPGTGDIHLTLAQQLQHVPVSGAVIVSTPQDIALLDARKGLNMFRKVDVPVLGIVENMSYFSCPHCGQRSEIFAHGGARKEAERLGVEFLGEIPLDIAIRETSDGGQPIVVSRPDSEHAKSYRAIARRILAKLAPGAARRAPPKIVVQ
jgi:ATP-binding protein involved in chromosome partitioning